MAGGGGALEAELSALRDDHAKAVQERDAAQHQGEQLRGDKARLLLSLGVTATAAAAVAGHHLVLVLGHLVPEVACEAHWGGVALKAAQHS
ncbi:hypothetical protein HaLaN_22611 [Haematococcus lacustris]|uniref:Uncharacterized protein n=1 Tax=Haematococcus lacustris TaxID=44745 RepID=A0A6A0A159_HAELA|nr:hypothetical protein HaLaN_22611 [Haematococcus lacustris]